MPSRILDRTMIYTAATRGIEQVVFVGDLRAATVATAAQPRAFGRRIGLRHLLRQKALP
jgi:exodeoxyribonuclease V alpha subunit